MESSGNSVSKIGVPKISFTRVDFPACFRPAKRLMLIMKMMVYLTLLVLLEIISRMNGYVRRISIIQWWIFEYAFFWHTHIASCCHSCLCFPHYACANFQTLIRDTVSHGYRSKNLVLDYNDERKVNITKNDQSQQFHIE